MKGTSKVIMGATLVMVVSLAIVLGLILVLLVELYCSLLLRRRQLRNNSSDTSTTATANTSSSQSSHLQDHSSTPPLTSVYAQGVLQAPRNILFPPVSSKEDLSEQKKQHPPLHQVEIDMETQESNTTPLQKALLSASSPPTSFVTRSPKKPNQEVPLQGSTIGSVCADKTCAGNEHFLYISNPIYDNDARRASESGTPFETPCTSPSRLEKSGSSGEDDVAQASLCSPHSPSLTPMKKLPAGACSVSLRDARSLGTSGSDSNSVNGLSSSSSGTPRTSPSW
ncbi:putative Transmembrane protein [Quillaja saponaria]|uniref:Transmembrane protein n=1 Tax=Quillaja saponaria TaxID=32244 RepID=A0AAD7M4C2_QUISA|nr:putative Transmembrane protein [Quillaja saponaria]